MTFSAGNFSTKNFTGSPFTYDRYCLAPFNASRKPLNHDPLIEAWATLTVLLCSTGTIANLLVLIIVLRFPSLRKGSGMVIAHLLACHVILCAVILPYATERVLKVTTGTESLSCEFCRYQNAFQITFTALVGWSEALLTINRLVAVFLPTHFELINSETFQIPALILAWGSALLFSVPPAMEHWGMYMMTPIGVCTLISRTRAAFALLSFNTYLPLGILATGAIAITGEFIRRQRALRRASLVVSQAGKRPMKPRVARTGERQRRVSRMLIVSFLVTLLCQLSLFVFVMSGMIARNPKLVLFVWLTALLQFTLNPIIFLAFNQDYKNKASLLFVILLGRSIKKGHPGVTGTLSQSVKSAGTGLQGQETGTSAGVAP